VDDYRKLFLVTSVILVMSLRQLADDLRADLSADLTAVLLRLYVPVSQNLFIPAKVWPETIDISIVSGLAK